MTSQLSVPRPRRHERRTPRRRHLALPHPDSTTQMSLTQLTHPYPCYLSLTLSPRFSLTSFFPPQSITLSPQKSTTFPSCISHLPHALLHSHSISSSSHFPLSPTSLSPYLSTVTPLHLSSHCRPGGSVRDTQARVARSGLHHHSHSADHDDAPATLILLRHGPARSDTIPTCPRHF